MERRKYASPLRERQAEQTRNEILDALVALLADRPVDEVTTRELAHAAGVAERTVYRHFPDRWALVEALTARFVTSGEVAPTYPARLEDLGASAIEIMRVLEAHHVEAQAEALLNADPRRFSTQTSRHSEQLHSLVETELPDLDAGQQRSLSAIARVLLSAQTWLRMRAEFGIDGNASGPVVAWVIEAMRHEIERGNPPPTS
jgi:AcrR family transcriptional regulator